jgi:hypothetical protein
MLTPETGTQALDIGPQFNRTQRVRTFESGVNPPLARERTAVGRTNTVKELVGRTVLAANRDRIDDFLDSDDNDRPTPKDTQGVLLFLSKMGASIFSGSLLYGMIFGQGHVIGTAWGSMGTAWHAYWAGKIGIAAFGTAVKVGVGTILASLGTAALAVGITAGLVYLGYRRVRYGSWFGKKKKK